MIARAPLWTDDYSNLFRCTEMRHATTDSTGASRGSPAQGRWHDTLFCVVADR
jgi:hypothetical protein